MVTQIFNQLFIPTFPKRCVLNLTMPAKWSTTQKFHKHKRSLENILSYPYLKKPSMHISKFKIPKGPMEKRVV